MTLTHARTPLFPSDGMLCYKLMGDESQASFAKGWGISCACLRACLLACLRCVADSSFDAQTG